ncbi:structural maintenance of chromosome 1 [Pycnococcus provasolii]
MAPMTFLPVTTIQAKQIDARLRSLGGTARLMMDVVTPNAAAVAAHPSAVDLKAKFERAARYAVGNTVVCDTLDEARRLCFGGGASAASAGSAAAASAPPPGPRIKAVDLEGTKIDKSGVMTGGTMHSLANRAGRWSEAQFEAVRKERTEAERELRSLPTAEQQKAAQDDLARRAASIQQQLGYAEKDLAEATKTLETLEREAAALEEEKKRTAAQTEKHAAEYARVASEVSGKDTKLRAELDDSVWRLFAPRGCREHCGARGALLAGAGGGGTTLQAHETVWREDGGSARQASGGPEGGGQAQGEGGEGGEDGAEARGGAERAVAEASGSRQGDGGARC